MVDAARDRFAQHCQCGPAILGWPENARAGQLHGAVPDAIYEMTAEFESI
jgi:hypothetical protein